MAITFAAAAAPQSPAVPRSYASRPPPAAEPPSSVAESGGSGGDGPEHASLRLNHPATFTLRIKIASHAAVVALGSAHVGLLSWKGVPPAAPAAR